MRSPTNRLLNAGSDALPPELATIVAAATIMERSSADENSMPRILVATARGSFHLERDDKHVRRWLENNWPGLSEAQTRRAQALLNARVLEVQREQVERANGSRWAAWTPLRGPGDRR